MTGGVVLLVAGLALLAANSVLATAVAGERGAGAPGSSRVVIVVLGLVLVVAGAAKLAGAF